MRDVEPILIGEGATIQQTMRCIDRGACGIAIIVDAQRRLAATITDGDIRRGVLAGAVLDQPVDTLLDAKASMYTHPTTAPLGTPDRVMLQLMQRAKVRHLPLLDAEQRVAGLILIDDLAPQPFPEAVIMAGGFGKRLAPLTTQTPKPMLPVGDRPLMELTIEQLRKAGIGRVNVTTHYLSQQITDHFGDGSDFGVELNYVTEDRPFGTAGALALMDQPDQPLLVINGDILTRVDFRAMIEFHRQHQADATVGVRRYEIQVPYGVVECDGAAVRALQEKPSLRFFVNAGIYLLEPSVLRFVPEGRRYDMTDLIDRLVSERCRVVSFPVLEYWLDIGRLDDYQRAQEDHKNGRLTR